MDDFELAVFAEGGYAGQGRIDADAGHMLLDILRDRGDIPALAVLAERGWSGAEQRLDHLLRSPGRLEELAARSPALLTWVLIRLDWWEGLAERAAAGDRQAAERIDLIVAGRDRSDDLVARAVSGSSELARWLLRWRNRQLKLED